MRFYTRQHRYYCGIDLHVRMMYVCILDQAGEVRIHRNMKACPERFLAAVWETAGHFFGKLGIGRWIEKSQKRGRTYGCTSC